MAPITNIDDPRVVKAIAHPLRVRLLGLLDGRTASPSELAAELGAPLGNVAYHIRTLYRLGFLELVKRTPRRGAVEHHYRALERPTVSDEAWAAASTAVKEALLGAALQQVGGYVSQAAQQGGFARPDAHLTRTAVELDEEGWHELAACLGHVLERVDEIESASRARREHGHAPALHVGVVLMQFEARPPAAEAGPADPAPPV